MSRSFFRAAVVVLASLLLTAGEAFAQEYATRYELGGQFSLLSRQEPTSQSTFFSHTEPPTFSEPGFGGRFTYNVTHHIAFEAEINFLPRPDSDPFTSGRFGVPFGHILQGQFGVKAGKRFRRLGVFAKLRPGFVRFGKVSTFTGSHEEVVRDPRLGEVHFQVPEFRFESQPFASTDVGVVLEFYASRRLLARFDLGDTIIRYSVYREQANNVCILSAPCIPEIYERPPETRHNLQFSAGVAYRF